MPTVSLSIETNGRDPNEGGLRQRKVRLSVDAWHPTIAGGSAVNETSGFVDPDTDAYADRVPQLALAGGGTPGDYVITGTYNGEARTDTLTTIAGATVKATRPYDTIVAISGPDPGANLDLEAGDTYADPPARALWTGPTGGDLECQLELDPSAQVISSLPASVDYQRRILRISPDSTTIPDGEAFLVW